MAVKPEGAIDPTGRLEGLIKYHDKRFQAVFLQAIDVIKDRYTLDELSDLLEAGQFEEALNAIEYAGNLLGNEFGATLSAAAADTAEFLSKEALTFPVSFDQTNVRAVGRMQENKLRLVQDFSADQRATLRQAMARGIEQGLNPREQARLFRDTVGLTPSQDLAVARYKQALEAAGTETPGAGEALRRKLRDKRFDRSVQRAIREGQPLTAEQITKMTSRYAERYVKYRAEVIGRTEAMRAVHEGTEELYEQAIESGDLEPDSLERTWVATSDGRTRHSHQVYNGEKRKIGEKWGPLRYPGDPSAPAEEVIQCRCSIATRMTG